MCVHGAVTQKAGPRALPYALVVVPLACIAPVTLRPCQQPRADGRTPGR